MPGKKHELDRIIAQSVEDGSQAVTEQLYEKCRDRKEAYDAEMDRMKKEYKKEYDLYQPGSAERRKLSKAYDSQVQAFYESNDPFYALFYTAWEMMGIWNKIPDADKYYPQQAVSQTLDSYQAPIDKKIEILSIMRENAEKNLYPGALEVSGAENEERKEKIKKYNERYHVGKLVESDKSPSGFDIASDTYTDNYKELVNCFQGMFSVPYEKIKDNPKRKRAAAAEIITFCNQKLTEYHQMMLTGDMKGEYTDGTDPYLNSDAFRANQQKYAERQQVEDMLDAERLQTKKLKDAKLFARGSQQFDKMKDAYEQLREIVKEHAKNSTPESYQKLSEQSRETRACAKAYLDFKHEQIVKGKVRVEVSKDLDGKNTYHALNPNTRKRMKYAEGLLDELKKLDAYIAKNQPGVKKEQTKAANKSATMQL